MYKCKYCGSLTNNPKQVKNNFHFECENCGKKSTFYTDLFDVVDDKGEEIIYTAKLGSGSGFSTNGTMGW